MEVSLYTIHSRPGRDLMAIADRFDLFALLLPVIWAIWHRLWGILGLMLLILAGAALITPLAISPVMYGIALILAFEGGEARRLERRFWGWREVGLVQAGSEEGAEELYLSGRVV